MGNYEVHKAFKDESWLKIYLNGFNIFEYLHEMCFTCYDFSFKKVFNVI